MSWQDGGRFDAVAWWGVVNGTRTAVIDAATGRRVDYAALHRDADQWAAALAASGVRPGERVAVLAPNRYEFLPLFVACLRMGAVLVPLNWRLAPPELERVLQHAEPVLLLHDARFAGRAREAQGPAATGCRVLDLDTDVPAWLAVATPDATGHRSPGDGESPVMLLYTSGTTGAPKGVIVTHRQLLWNAVSTGLGWSLHEDDVAAVATPFFHTAAWHVFTTPLLHCGGCVVLLPQFDADTLLSVLDRYGVTRTFCVPTQLQRLQQAADWGRPLPALRTFVSGGAPLPVPVLTAARRAGYPVRDAYGLTEFGPNCVVMPDALVDRMPASVGWPLPFVRMRVVRDDGSPAAAGEIGELQLDGPQRFAGYFRDAVCTTEAFTADGWVRTGDVAVMDPDGAYRLCGRRKELFISGGENVYPGEVEAALVQCAGVRAAAVVAVPDETWGEVGIAVVVADGNAVSAAELLHDLRQRLAGYKVPRGVLFVPSLPTLGSGKLDRRAVRSLALGLRGGEH